jgi:hypothetical protein
MPKRKHEPSQAPSLYDLCAPTAAKQEEPAQSSTPSLLQEQETIVEPFPPELHDIADYILHNTNWIVFWSKCKSLREDTGLKSKGSGNFTKTRQFERAFAKSLKGGTHIDDDCDFTLDWVKFDRPLTTLLEGKFSNGSTSTFKKNGEVKVTCLNTRPSSQKGDKQWKRTDPDGFAIESHRRLQESHEKWLKKVRYEFLILVNYVDQRVFITTSEFTKANSEMCSSGVVVIYPPNTLFEIQWHHVVDPFFEYIEIEKQYSYIREKAIVEWENQFE